MNCEKADETVANETSIEFSSQQTMATEAQSECERLDSNCDSIAIAENTKQEVTEKGDDCEGHAITVCSVAPVVVCEHKAVDSVVNSDCNNKQSNKNEICDKMNDMSLDADDYPEEYNPFADDDNEGEDEEIAADSSKNYPQDLNPFGSSEEEEEQSSPIKADNSSKEYNSSLNPFGSDSEEEEQGQDKPSISPTPIPAPRRSLQTSAKGLPPSSNSWSTSSLERNKSKVNKLPPPRPPPPTLFSKSGLTNSETNVSLDYEKLSVSKSLSNSPLHTTPEGKKKVFKRKPAPKPPGHEEGGVKDINSDHSLSVGSESIPCTPESARKESSRRSSLDIKGSMSPSTSIRSTSSVSENDSTSEKISNENSILNQSSYWRNKKRKAPPIPIPMRRIAKGSLEEIQKELNDIGNRLAVNDKRTMDILEIMQNDKGHHRQRKLIYEYLLLSQEKCAFAKKQEELMYLKREHKLEEEHADIEYKMRILISKPESMKSEEDSEKEEELLQKLVDIIEERNEICENMIKIDKRIDFNLLVEKVKQIKGESVVNPVLQTFMKNSYNEVKYTANKVKNVKAKGKKEKSDKSGKSAFHTLKKMAKAK